MRQYEPENIMPLMRRMDGVWVLLSRDMAKIHGVPSTSLHREIECTPDRFPTDFVLRLPGARPAYAFTEQGVGMLCSVLRSRRRIAANIAIMRSFVRLRRRAYDA